MPDKRATARINLLDFQPVQDAATGKVVGYLGDVSPDGVKLLSKKEIPLGTKLRLRLRYVCHDGDTETPDLDAESIWQRHDEAQAFVETGFKLTNVDAAILASIERIVADLRERN